MKHSHYYSIVLLFTPLGITDTFGCSPNSDGLYGETGAFDTVVSFAYEIDVATNQREKVSTEVIPALEIFFSTRLLMDLFPATCSTLEASSIQEIVGLSTLGVDTVREGTTCDASISSATCMVVDGEITLYFSEQSALDWSSIVLAHLEKRMIKSMIRGTFIGTTIKRVAMYKGTPTPPSALSAPSSSPKPSLSNEPSAVPKSATPTIWLEDTIRPLLEAIEGNWKYALVLFGLLILVFICICCCCRRMCKKEEYLEDEKDDESDLDTDEENPSEFLSDEEDHSEVDSDEEDPSEVDTDEEDRSTDNERDLESDEEDPSEVESDEEDHSEVASDEEDQSEVESDEEDHSEVDSDEENPSEVLSDEEDQSEVDSDEDDHSEVDSDEENPSEVLSDEEDHSEVDSNEEDHSEVDSDEDSSDEDDK